MERILKQYDCFEENISFWFFKVSMIIYLLMLILYFIGKKIFELDGFEFYGNLINRLLNFHLLYSKIYLSSVVYSLYKRFYTINNSLVPKIIWENDFYKSKNTIEFKNLKNLHKFLYTLIEDLNDRSLFIFCLTTK